jgi:DNA-binding transcriptional LysR family regulator
MHWDDIRYFLALKRTGNLTQAARQLGIRHSTVSRRVETLEQALGVKLFDRLPRGWVPTEEAEALWPQALEMERQALEFSRNALGQSGEVGSVRIAGPPVLLSHFLVPRLATWQQLDLGLRLHLLAGTGTTNLVQGEAELVLRVGLPVEHTDLLKRPLGMIRYGLYGTRQQLALSAKQQRYLGFDPTMSGSAQNRWLEDAAEEKEQSLVSNDLEVLFHAARAGWGLAVLPNFLAEEAPELICANPEERWLRPVSLLTHPDVRRAKRVQHVTDMLDQLFRQAAATLNPQ